MFSCVEHGICETVHLDGYYLAERLLEGVIFIGVYNKKTKKYKCTGVSKDCVKYFSGLNQKKWIKMAQDAMNDHSCCEVRCPQCEEGDMEWIGKEPETVQSIGTVSTVRATKANIKKVLGVK